MLNPRRLEFGRRDTGTAVVRIDVLLKFAEVVRELGGDPAALLIRSQIDPTSLNNRHAMVAHRAYAQVLERAATELRCPDFGMRLAAAQGGIKALGPLGYVMRNSQTLREAYSYCVDHVRAYGSALHMRFEPPTGAESVFLRVEFMIPRMPHPQQLERALLLSQRSAAEISNGTARPREVWFTHDAISGVATYTDHFKAPVRFGQPMSGLWFASSDLDTINPQADEQVYELALNYLEQRFPSTDSIMTPRIRLIVERLLLEGNCTHQAVAVVLGMHPRALQRRLKAEGGSFEAIRDAVRREIALRYLKESSMPLIRVARMLGYSETSALSRSCYRWFSASARQVRGHGR